MDYLKKENESLKEYQIRLYKNKDVYGLNNNEISDLLNKEYGYNYDESKYRKFAIPYIEGWNDCLKEKVNNNDILSEIDKKQEELYKQQIKTRDKTREYRSLLRDEARIDNLKETIIECANIVAKNNNIIINKKYIKDNEKVAVVQLSDWHFNEIVSNFLNEYNEDVFNKRIEILTNKVINICKNNNIKHIKVLNHNDHITGNIHVTSRVNSEEDIIYQIQYVSETMAKMFEKWCSEFNAIEFYNVTDNHSRANKNKKEHIEKENFVRFIPWYLEARMKNVENFKIIKNIINEIEDYDIGVVDIFNEKALFTHGHCDSIKSIISDLSFMTRIFPIAVFMGHIHKNYEDEHHMIDLIVSPSMIGNGNYSKDIRASSKARQKLTIFENVEGKVERSGTFFINF